jgi:hypothetical protein
MTDHKATPEQWETIAEYAKDLNSGPACLLELRARVEALENKSETQCLAILDWGKDVEAIKCWNEQQVLRIMALEAAQQDKLDRLIAQDRDDAPAPTDSLVEQVADGISKPLQLTPEQAQQISDLLAPNSKSTPNPSQIRSSLVDRVAAAIWKTCDLEIEARAAIREVAAWMREQHDGDLVAATMLEREAEQ